MVTATRAPRLQVEAPPHKYQHILCVYPYRVKPGGSMGWPPLGLEIIAAVLEERTEAIDIVDLRCERAHTVDFLRPDTDLVCFSVNWERQIPFVRDEIRSVPSHILTVVGGRHATEDPEKWLSECPNIDVLVRGDGEEVVDEISSGRTLDQVAGISFRRNGKTVHNRGRQCVPANDDLYPNRGLRRYSYSLDLGGVKGRKFDTVVSSRGCPFNCTVCSFSRNPWGEKRRWSARSPESVVREIEETDADIIGFLDDVFTHDPDRVAAICDLLIARGIRKRYAVNARLEIARRPDVLKKMERAGFSLLLLGIESAEDRALRAMGKGFTTSQVRDYFRVLRRSKMLLLGYFILGNIGETQEEMRRIMPFARELGVDLLNLCLLRNEPHSGMDDLIARSPGYHIDAETSAIYSDDCPLGDLQRLQRKMLFGFYNLAHMLRVIKKSLGNKMITPGMLARVPWFLFREAARFSTGGNGAWGTD